MAKQKKSGFTKPKKTMALLTTGNRVITVLMLKKKFKGCIRYLQKAISILND